MKNGTLLTLRGVDLNENAEEEPMIAIRMWVTDRALVSLARYPFRASEDALAELDAGAGPTAIGGLLAQIIDGLTDRMEAIIEGLTDRVSEIEDRVIHPRKSASRAELADIRLDIITQLRYFTPQQLAIAVSSIAPRPSSRRTTVSSSARRTSVSSSTTGTSPRPATARASSRTR